MSKKLRPELISACSRHACPVFEADGYRCLLLAYTRSFSASGVKHRVDVGAQWSPSSQPGALVMVYPRFYVFAPGVNEIYNEMTDSSLPRGSKTPLLNVPLDWFSAEESGYWYVMSKADFDPVVREFADFYSTYVRGPVDELDTLEGLVVAGETADRRFVSSRQDRIIAAAAAMVIGAPDRALRILELGFPSAGARRTYAQAFEYVESRQV